MIISVLILHSSPNPLSQTISVLKIDSCYARAERNYPLIGNMN